MSYDQRYERDVRHKLAGGGWPEDYERGYHDEFPPYGMGRSFGRPGEPWGDDYGPFGGRLHAGSRRFGGEWRNPEDRFRSSSFEHNRELSEPDRELGGDERYGRVEPDWYVDEGIGAGYRRRFGGGTGAAIQEPQREGMRWGSEHGRRSTGMHGFGVGGRDGAYDVYGAEPYVSMSIGAEWPGARTPFRGHRRNTPKNYRRSDERIREDICDALSSEDIDATEIEINVKNGEVTLTGTVPHREMKYVAERVADCCPGVTDIANNLRVREPQREKPVAQDDVTTNATSSGGRRSTATRN
jgi:hypothetical protein